MKIGVLYKENDIKSLDCLNEFKSKCQYECIDLNCNEKVDYIICFGGDGTTLKSVKYAVQFDAPVISVNSGNLGFLSAYNANEVDKLICDLQHNNINFTKKVLLEFTENNCSHYALNEVIVERNHANYSETNLFRLKLNESAVQSAVCDGIIISTPTGSTAYSLSAGGSILHPSVNAFIATFICSHSNNSHPIVFNDEHLIEITCDKATMPAAVFVDGIMVSKLTTNSKLLIKKSIHITCID